MSTRAHVDARIVLRDPVGDAGCHLEDSYLHNLLAISPSTAQITFKQWLIVEKALKAKGVATDDERRLVIKVDDEATTSGLKWQKTPGTPPAQSIEVPNADKLLEALQGGKLEFTQAEWSKFGVNALTRRHVVKADGAYFQPVATTGGSHRYFERIQQITGVYKDTKKLYEQLCNNDRIQIESTHHYTQTWKAIMRSKHDHILHYEQVPYALNCANQEKYNVLSGYEDDAALTAAYRDTILSKVENVAMQDETQTVKEEEQEEEQEQEKEKNEETAKNRKKEIERLKAP
eukprot:4027547-Prymnesium_polylepis.1